MKKVPATFEFEKILWKQNIKYVVGVDEVGRGAWAGPLVAGAVVFPINFNAEHKFFDSKMLSPTEREKSEMTIKQVSLASSVGVVEVNEIEQMGLSKANQVAFYRAINNLSVKAEHVLVDAFFLKFFPRTKQTPIVHGDQISASISAASIVAKVFRDNLMREVVSLYPNYGFENHKGYGTKSHQEAVRKFGLSAIHRHNYNLAFLNE